jgi:hypothetical protein
MITASSRWWMGSCAYTVLLGSGAPMIFKSARGATGFGGRRWLHWSQGLVFGWFFAYRASPFTKHLRVDGLGSFDCSTGFWGFLRCSLARHVDENADRDDTEGEARASEAEGNLEEVGGRSGGGRGSRGRSS